MGIYSAANIIQLWFRKLCDEILLWLPFLIPQLVYFVVMFNDFSTSFLQLVGNLFGI